MTGMIEDGITGAPKSELGAVSADLWAEQAAAARR